MLCICANFLSAAQDAEMLATLVQKGIITAGEATEIKKASAETSPAVEISPLVRDFNMVFYAQTRYMLVSQKYSGLSEKYQESGFTIRRVIIAPSMNIGDDFHFQMSISMTSKPFITDSCSVSKIFDGEYFCGRLQGGYLCAPVSMEQDESGSRLLAMERSIPSNYWGGGDWYYVNGFRNAYNSRLCLSGGHMGLMWRGELPRDKRYKYGFGITNSQGQYIKPQKGNDLAYWLYFRYNGNVSQKLKLHTGINGGYANKLMGIITPESIHVSECSNYVSTITANPFIFVTYADDTQLKIEFFGNVMENGKTQKGDVPWYTTTSKRAMPVGGVATLLHRFQTSLCTIEPVFRYSYLNTDGRGISPSEVYYGLKTKDGLYNKSNGFYFGVNWLLNKHYAMLSTGYTYIKFSDNPVSNADKSSVAQVFAAQFQVRF